MFHDLRYAVRLLLKSPGFTAAAVLTLALGIGATTLMFTVTRQVLLAPLPYPHSDRLAVLTWNKQDVNGGMLQFFSAQDRLFENSAATFYSPGCNLVGGGRPEYVPSGSVSPSFFRTLQVQPFLGRDFLPADAESSTVAILSYRVWRQHFNSDPTLIGKQVKCNGAAYTVIGVLPPSFRFFNDSDVWFTEPITAPRYANDIGANYSMLVRLRDGLTFPQAQAQLDRLSDTFRKQFPRYIWGDKKGQDAEVQPLAGFLHESSSGGIWLLFGAVVLVLVIATANVAGLMVARAVGRGREIAIRTAVGASRARLFSQLLTESIVLHLLGGAGGLALAFWGMDLVSAAITSMFPEVAPVHLDWPVLAFALAVAVLAGMISGVLPAWHVARGDANAWMKHGTAARGQRRSRKVLVVTEVALALVLLSGSALLLRSFARTRSVSPGFDMHNLYAARLSMGQQKYQATAPVASFFHDAVERVNRTPGVRAAAEAAVPLRRGLNLGLKGGTCDTGGIQFRAITPDFFSVMGIPVLRGRAFAESENAPVAIVNEKLAKACWPAGDALGSALVAGSINSRLKQPRSIVGVVGSTREYGLARPESSVIYVPVWQVPDHVMKYNNGIFTWSLVARTSAAVDVDTLIRRAVQDTDDEQAIMSVDPVTTLAGNGLQDQRMIASVMTAFGLAALLLTAVGLYALLAYYVAERTREIGIRMALGAAHREVIAMILREGMALVLIGAAIGMIAAIAASRALRGSVAGLGAIDPAAMLFATVVLAASAMLAAWLPARRAARLDPMVALRWD